MIDETAIDNNLPFSSATGWMQMEVLLNKNLPVRKKKGYIELLLSAIPSLLLCIIFLFSFLQLDTHLLPTTFNQPASTIASAVLPGEPLITMTTSHYLAIIKINNHLQIDKSINADKCNSNTTKSKNQHEPNNNSVSFLKKISKVENGVTEMNRNHVVQIDKNALTSSKPYFPITIDPTKKQRRAIPWELSAGIGMNIAAGSNQQLQPYPMAEIKYHLSSRLFVAAGLSLFSPAPASVSGISKTVYINDTINNIRQYNEIVNYNRMRYADIPVFVGFNISKNIFFQAGLQASFLLSKSVKKTLQPYDFQMNYTSMPFDPTQGMAANPQQEFEVSVKNMQYRFITGIKYRQNKITAGLFYQQAFKPSGIGNTINKKTNGLFTLSLLYQLK